MNAKEVVGKKIVKVYQQKFWNTHVGAWDVSIDALELDNGTMISFTACESETEPFVTAQVVKAKSKIT